MNTELKKKIRAKSRLHKRARDTGNWDAYKEHQKMVKSELKKAEDEYVHKAILEGLKNKDSKPFWRYVKSRKRDNIGVSPLFSNGKLESDSKTKADILLNQFSSVFTTDDSTDMPPVDKRVEENVQIR